jgi:hypothetical protein
MIAGRTGGVRTTPATAAARFAKRQLAFLARRQAYLEDQRRMDGATSLTPRARADVAPGVRSERFAELDAEIAAEERYGPQRAFAAGAAEPDGLYVFESEAAK